MFDNTHNGRSDDAFLELIAQLADDRDRIDFLAFVLCHKNGLVFIWIEFLTNWINLRETMSEISKLIKHFLILYAWILFISVWFIRSDTVHSYLRVSVHYLMLATNLPAENTLKL